MAPKRTKPQLTFGCNTTVHYSYCWCSTAYVSHTGTAKSHAHAFCNITNYMPNGRDGAGLGKEQYLTIMASLCYPSYASLGGQQY